MPWSRSSARRSPTRTTRCGRCARLLRCTGATRGAERGARGVVRRPVEGAYRREHRRGRRPARCGQPDARPRRRAQPRDAARAGCVAGRDSPRRDDAARSWPTPRRSRRRSGSPEGTVSPAKGAYRLLELVPTRGSRRGQSTRRSSAASASSGCCARRSTGRSPRTPVSSSPCSASPGSGSRGWRGSSAVCSAGVATVLVGRCPSYGDGVTYWPVREIVEQAAAPGRGLEELVEGLEDGPAVAGAVAAALGLEGGVGRRGKPAGVPPADRVARPGPVRSCSSSRTLTTGQSPPCSTSWTILRTGSGMRGCSSSASPGRSWWSRGPAGRAASATRYRSP